MDEYNILAKKVRYLERLVKNLYHARDIEYHLHEGDVEIFDYIDLIDVNGLDDVPKLYDCCDDGLEQDTHLEAVLDEDLSELDEKERYRVKINVEVWFGENRIQKIEDLEKELKKLKDVSNT